MATNETTPTDAADKLAPLTDAEIEQERESLAVMRRATNNWSNAAYRGSGFEMLDRCLIRLDAAEAALTAARAEVDEVTTLWEDRIELCRAKNAEIIELREELRLTEAMRQQLLREKARVKGMPLAIVDKINSSTVRACDALTPPQRDPAGEGEL